MNFNNENDSMLQLRYIQKKGPQESLFPSALFRMKKI
jgi:hypothetical protein